MALFRNFPLLNYKFGDETNTAIFQNLSAYIDLIDQVADDASFYTKYTIQDGDRPDVVSYKLYNTTEYYWTFYLLNENIRLQGWPLTTQQLYANSRKFYPNTVIKTEENVAAKFQIGDTAVQGSIANPTAKGRVVERNLDLGQIVIRPIIEVRSIGVLSGGTGYIDIPQVTITGGGGAGAVAQATVQNGSVTSINILSGGSDYTTAPTITIAPPKVIDYNAVAVKIGEIVNGSIISGNYYNFLTATVSGFARGDVDNSGGLSLTDSVLMASYAANPTNVSNTIRNKIESILRPAILSNAAIVPDFVPGGAPGVTATASATISTNAFTTNRNLQTVVNEPNNLNWDINNIQTALVKSVVNQYDSIHHYEDTNGNWVDIDPFNMDASSSGLIPITHFERLQRQNDNLKEIKVLKPSVAAQVFSEFQKLLSRR
jgi:hypothetical protein